MKTMVTPPPSPGERSRGGPGWRNAAGPYPIRCRLVLAASEARKGVSSQTNWPAG